MTVKVVTDAGVWLAWGSVPSNLVDHGDNPAPSLKGAEVEFTATLTRGREVHFALFKRPTKARIVTPSSGRATG